MARATKSDLLSCLKDASAECVEMAIAGGGSALVATRGARILGLFPGKDPAAHNALWTNEQIADLLAGKIRDWEGEGAGSIGGERLWVSPERSFYYRRPEAFGEWFAPLAMDPGNYRLVSNEDGRAPTYENMFDLEDVRAGRTYRNVRLTRQFKAAGDPFPGKHALKALMSRVHFAGVRKSDSIELPDAPADAKIGLWTLALVDPGPDGGIGTVVVPVRSGAKAIDYFGGLAAERVVARKDHVAFRADGESIGKIGVRPEDLDLGRAVPIAAFLPSRSKSRLLLVIQRSKDVPRSQDECLDEAKADPAGPKGVIQAYNSGPGADPNAPYKRFGEIEIQLAAARPTGEGPKLAATAISDLLAFEGPREDILTVGQSLLGLGTIKLFEK
jgi:hypothetical protein